MKMSFYVPKPEPRKDMTLRQAIIKEIADLLQGVKGLPEFQVISISLLRSDLVKVIVDSPTKQLDYPQGM